MEQERGVLRWDKMGEGIGMERVELWPERTWCRGEEECCCERIA